MEWNSTYQWKDQISDKNTSQTHIKLTYHDDVDIEIADSQIPISITTGKHVNTGSLWNISRGPYTKYITLIGLILLSIVLCLLSFFYVRRMLRRVKTWKHRRREIRDTHYVDAGEHVVYNSGEVEVLDANDTLPVGLSAPLIEDVLV